MYKDKDKQKEANKEAMRRYRKAEKQRKEREGITSPAFAVIPKQDSPTVQAIKMAAKLVKIAKDRPKATSPAVQAIWDKRNAQGQPASYSYDATPKDYPRIQRPLNSPEPSQAGQTKG